MKSLLVIIFIPVILVMAIDLSWKIQRSKIDEKIRMDKLKAERDYLDMKQATKLSYGERQRLNFALGKHWKR
ncbi:hypothetical protein CIW83_09700 [Tissierella sp. P1]|jgi:ABC-type iron transport system FetAB ATPase subunit|uniref:hypothetical protein n=1 Tax=Tissierella sp. P1 TaxID=1280483 RepID=UPI000BA069D0|nr:hypothetical protein [Tissierella sp. P1]OZV12361.1 hypothetical protein CIW83_09700 [Tissierella sp. P1]